MNRQQRRHSNRHQPKIKLVGYRNLQIELPRLEPTSEEIEAEVDQHIASYAESVSVDRSPQVGDSVVLDLNMHDTTGNDADQHIPNWHYEIGSKVLGSEFDDLVLSLKPLDEGSCESVPPEADLPLQFRITLREVLERKKPELTDEWVAKVSPVSEGAEHYQSQLVNELRHRRQQEVRNQLRTKTLDGLADLVEGADSIVQREYEKRHHAFREQLASDAVDIEEFCRARNKSVEEVNDEMFQAARSEVCQTLGLQALADAENIQATPEEIEEARRQIRSNKALDWMMQNVIAIDSEGERIDLSELGELTQ